MPVFFPKSDAEVEALSERFKPRQHSFKEHNRKQTSYLEHAGWCVAQNFKVFSSRVARAVNGNAGEMRPQFNLRSISKPTTRVAMLVAHPLAKFSAACREDKIEASEALEILKAGKFPSFHFFPQARYLSGHEQEIFAWRAPDHVADFWNRLELGEPPDIYPPKESTAEDLSEIYKDDFDLWEAITIPGKKIKTRPDLATKFSTLSTAIHRFARSGFSTTPPEILATREATCRACAEWDAEALNATGRCRKCGCSTWAKLRMATERCPLGKWEAVSVTSVSSVVNPSEPLQK